MHVNYPKQAAVLIAIAAFVAISPMARAAVTAQEAARLKSDLTPLGAERAGNKAGTIPAWTGGYTRIWPGYRSGQPRPDPFADEKPVLRITAANADHYADKLSDGILALLKRLPGYRLDVYPTHRTAAAPAWVYANTFTNATRARTTHNGLSVEGAYGGIPFPIPHSGAEAMWNHLLAWKGESGAHVYGSYIVANGKVVLSSAARLDWQYPYYYRHGSLQSFNGIYGLGKITTLEPPNSAGENIVVQQPIDSYHHGSRIWVYLTGQRRVRRAPMISYDSPNTATSGFNVVDEAYLFNGALDRYTWKIIGKKEMFIPYNTQAFHAGKVAQVLGPKYPNPDSLRWELHRVWVIEATLAPGKRHVLPRRRFYLDEDTWQAVLADGWDAKGQLWHVAYTLPFIVPELPAVVTYPYVVHDLLRDGYAASSLFNGRSAQYRILVRRPDEEFTPAALAAEGIR